MNKNCLCIVISGLHALVKNDNCPMTTHEYQVLSTHGSDHTFGLHFQYEHLRSCFKNIYIHAKIVASYFMAIDYSIKILIISAV